MDEFVGAKTRTDLVPKSRVDIECTFHGTANAGIDDAPKDKEEEEPQEEEPRDKDHLLDQGSNQTIDSKPLAVPASPPTLKRRTRAEILQAMKAKKKKPPVDYRNNRLSCFFLSQSKAEIAYVEAGVNNFPAYLWESVTCLLESDETRLSLQVDVVANKADPTDYSRAATFVKTVQAKDASNSIGPSFASGPGSPMERRINVFLPVFVRLSGADAERNDDKTKAWARNLCKFFTRMQNSKASYPRETVFHEHIVPQDDMAYLGAWITIPEVMDVARLYYNKQETEVLSDDSILRSLWSPIQIPQVKNYYRRRGTILKEEVDLTGNGSVKSSVLEALGLELEDM